jgi:hypothetical protein
MPEIAASAEIEVRAPAALAFEVIAGDLLKVVDQPDAMTGHRPTHSGPLRQGFRWRQWVVHERRRCLSDWVVTSIESPFHLEQSMWHFCAVAKSQVFGGERWELVERADGPTIVRLRSWTLQEGVGAWVQKLVGWGGSREAKGFSLRKRLAYVQFEAERRARG